MKTDEFIKAVLKSLTLDVIEEDEDEMEYEPDKQPYVDEIALCRNYLDRLPDLDEYEAIELCPAWSTGRMDDSDDLSDHRVQSFTGSIRYILFSAKEVLNEATA